MRRGILFFVSVLLLAPVGAGAAPRKLRPAPRLPAVPQLMQSCDAHKFETVVHAVVEGEPHDSKVKLCGIQGQSDADWIKTLRDSIDKLQANKDMAPAVREQIVTAINAEIGRLSIVGSAPTPSVAQETSRAAAVPLARDYSSLPPLPPPREIPAVPMQKDFVELPPLPVALPPVAPSMLAPPALVPAVVLHLTFGCDAPGDLATDAPCADFERETMLTVHARDDVPAGTLLQFVRNDRSQAELPLDGLRRGGALRSALPAAVCRGFASGKLELRIVRGGVVGTIEPAGSEGPYVLRC